MLPEREREREVLKVSLLCIRGMVCLFIEIYILCLKFYCSCSLGRQSFDFFMSE